ncbi:MAG TPA: tRNA uridine-5-carboxymethylaminomethyl(34) synthesis GTPase MnmE [Gammaproteobacteria bacterium]|nr:tRNA uridine-5-carboxymethylaminomethyl(34) synthesis GTPase MnmE [Gammaproteobacteria bacterium]
MEKLKVETIAALATPPGRGGVAVIRVAGPLVPFIAETITQKKLTPRYATHTAFFNETGDVLDDGLAIYFKAPHSFTGDEVLELQGHGGPVVVDLVLQRVLALGARLARPGEFSERAFLNGKMDLVQVEAVADLIDAASTQAAKLALKSLQGDFSRAVHALTESLIQLRLYLEAMIDFADEAVDYLSYDTVTARLNAIQADLTRLLRDSQQGSFLREGIHVVIAGEPNVGKSSLLNTLSGKALAIVTPIAGTTRDVLRDHILLDDLPVHIIDTAGLRESDDIVEQEGIKRARAEIESADLILYLIDATRHDIDVEYKKATAAYPKQKLLMVVNKADLVSDAPALSSNQLLLSAKTGEGLPLLKQKIKTMVGFQPAGEGVFLARRRHLDALTRAQTHLNTAAGLLKQANLIELIAEEFTLAQNSLSEITGEFTPDDLLGRIFSTFCIGK